MASTSAQHASQPVRRIAVRSQPLELVLETIGDFQTGDRLKVIIDCHPTPLFRILERNGYGYRTEPGKESVHEITIWLKD